MAIFAQRNVDSVKPAGWQMWKILSGAAVQQAHFHEAAFTVRLIRPARRAAETPVEAQIVSVLATAGAAVAYDSLVQLIADELYRKELRQGGANLDIGLFGSRLFDRDVISVLKSADGILWEIIGEQKI